MLASEIARRDGFAVRLENQLNYILAFEGLCSAGDGSQRRTLRSDSCVLGLCAVGHREENRAGNIRLGTREGWVVSRF